MSWTCLNYTHLCTIEIPNDAQSVKFKDKYYSDKIIILDKPVPFNEHIIWENYEICKLIIQQNGQALAFVKHQTDKICKLAVQQNGCALRYVNNQTNEICKLALQQNGCALRYVNNQTDEICKLAVQQDECALYALKYMH